MGFDGLYLQWNDDDDDDDDRCGGDGKGDVMMVYLLKMMIFHGYVK